MADWVKGKVYKGYAQSLLKTSNQVHSTTEDKADRGEKIEVCDQQNMDLKMQQEEEEAASSLNVNRYKYPALHTLFDPQQQQQVKQDDQDEKPIQ